jgi:hypothetical protein
MKNIIFIFVLLFTFLPSCTIYNEAEDTVNIQVVTADLGSILDRLNQIEAKTDAKLEIILRDFDIIKPQINSILAQGEINRENLFIIRSILTQIESTLLQIAITQQQQGVDLVEIKKQLMENYLLLLSINNNLNDVKAWTLENKDKLTQLIALFGGLENMTNTILSTLIAQGTLQAQMFEKIQALTLQMSVLQSSLETWGSLIVSKIDQLGLTLQQQGIILANILANTSNLPFFTAQVLAKLDALQLSVNEIKSLQMAIIDHLYEIKGTLANLQAVVNSIFVQVLLLQEGQLDILIAINNKLCGGNTTIFNSYNYAFNEYFTNITNISQIYNACSNGLGGCSGGVVPPGQVCMVLNIMNPFIVGNNNNVNYNFGNLYNIGYGNTNSISNNFGC